MHFWFCPIEFQYIKLQEGFWFHHAEQSYLMLANWIPGGAHTLPANASHRVGVGAFVFNEEKREVFFPAVHQCKVPKWPPL